MDNESPAARVAPTSFKKRFGVFAVFTGLVIAGQLVFSYVQSHRITEVPMDDAATTDSIVAGFNHICDSPAFNTPEYEDKFAYVYQCPIGEYNYWMEIDRGNGDAIRLMRFLDCEADSTEPNTISGGKWLVNTDADLFPAEVIAQFPEGTRLWWCPTDE